MADYPSPAEILQGDHFRVDTVSLPPSSDIPDGVVKGKGSWRGESHFTAAIRNVLTFLRPYKPSVIMPQIWPYLSSCHATAACLAAFFFFHKVSSGALPWNVMNIEGLVDVCLSLSAVTGKGWKFYLGFVTRAFFLFLFLHFSTWYLHWRRASSSIHMFFVEAGLGFNTLASFTGKFHVDPVNGSAHMRFGIWHNRPAACVCALCWCKG